jgi:uncharacterized protein with HEPN domain
MSRSLDLYLEDIIEAIRKIREDIKWFLSLV